MVEITLVSMEEKTMSAGQIAEQLSFREFQSLCTFVDTKSAGRKVTIIRFQHGDGSNVQVVGPTIGPAKFDILSIERSDTRVVVAIRLASGDVFMVGWAGKVVSIQSGKKAA